MEKLRSNVKKLTLVNNLTNEDEVSQNSNSKLKKFSQSLTRPSFGTLGNIVKMSKTAVKSFFRKSANKTDAAISYEARKFNKALEGCKSDIPCGFDTFITLFKIKNKDSLFNLPLPETIMLNFGFEMLTLISSRNKLTFSSIENLPNTVNKLIESSIRTKSGLPIAIFKYPGRLRRFMYDKNELLSQFPDSDISCIVQQFIHPKGLKAIKYRVILNEFAKVLIYSNKSRIDGEEECHKKRKHIPRPMSSSALQSTLVNHHELSKVVQSDINWRRYSNKTEVSVEKASIFNMFCKPPSSSEKHLKPLKNIKASTRLLTHEEIEITALYEGKNQSFSTIISMTEYLRAKIDYYILENTRLTELAVDYIQDAAGRWFLLKIKYGKTLNKRSPPKPFQKVQKKKVILKSIHNLITCSK